jgi:GNAT superfamily N-acetyltransferase
MTSVTVTNKSTATVNESRVPKTEIRLCTYDEFVVLADPLFEEHYEEIARNKQIMKLKPNYQLYEALNSTGWLFIYVAMRDDVCIGYSMNIMMHHLHYADLRIAQNDILFVKKEFRGGRLGLRLIKVTEDHARSEGCKLMLWHAKENTALAELLPKLKYGVQEIMYSKEI